MAQQNTLKSAKDRIDALAQKTQAYTQLFKNLGNITNQMRYLSTITTKIQDEVSELNTKLQNVSIPEVDANIQNIETLAGQMKNDLQTLYTLIPDAYPEETNQTEAQVGAIAPKIDDINASQQVGGYIWRKSNKKSRKHLSKKRTMNSISKQRKSRSKRKKSRR